jgi:2-polyprenyl-6-methoxyphenol hydroxylase-like FAD-dependent oxidoreductase
MTIETSTSSLVVPIFEAPYAAAEQSFDPASTLGLEGLKLLVVGAGPAGLAIARATSQYGASVEVIEQAGDPRGKNPGYTDRSFNLTLDNVGRTVLRSSRAWTGSTDVIGRAVHSPGDGFTKYAPYQGGPEARSTSIPRPVLRQNLVSLAENEGADIEFNKRVLEVDPDRGRLVTADERVHSADLIVVSDGLHSVSDPLIREMAGAESTKKPERLSYVTATLAGELNHGLSLHHIHFWHEEGVDSYTIGLPNDDGSISLLFISNFADVEPDAHPFATPDDARRRLARDFPQLLSLDPNLPNQLTTRQRGRFYYKSTNQFVLGDKGVVVGDAGCAAPPWVGWGANSALHGADTLVRFMVACEGDVDAALENYQTHLLALSGLMHNYIKDHGDFLGGRVAKHPEERSTPTLRRLIVQACEDTGLSIPTIHPPDKS